MPPRSQCGSCHTPRRMPAGQGASALGGTASGCHEGPHGARRPTFWYLGWPSNGSMRRGCILCAATLGSEPRSSSAGPLQAGQSSAAGIMGYAQLRGQDQHSGTQVGEDTLAAALSALKLLRLSRCGLEIPAGAQLHRECAMGATMAGVRESPLCPRPICNKCGHHMLERGTRDEENGAAVLRPVPPAV